MSLDITHHKMLWNNYHLEKLRHFRHKTLYYINHLNISYTLFSDTFEVYLKEKIILLYKSVFKILLQIYFIITIKHNLSTLHRIKIH